MQEIEYYVVFDIFLICSFYLLQHLPCWSDPLFLLDFWVSYWIMQLSGSTLFSFQEVYHNRTLLLVSYYMWCVFQFLSHFLQIQTSSSVYLFPVVNLLYQLVWWWKASWIWVREQCLHFSNVYFPWSFYNNVPSHWQSSSFSTDSLQEHFTSAARICKILHNQLQLLTWACLVLCKLELLRSILMCFWGYRYSWQFSHEPMPASKYRQKKNFRGIALCRIVWKHSRNAINLQTDIPKQIPKQFYSSIYEQVSYRE